MRTFSRSNRLSPRNWSWGTRGLVAAGTLFLFVLLLVGFQLIRGGGQNSVDSNGSASTPQPIPTATSSPDGGSTQQGTPDETEYQLDNTCLQSLGASAYAAFEDRVAEYEQWFRSPPSPDRDKGIAPYVTAQYQADHTGTASDEGSDTLVKLLRDKSEFSCTVDTDGSRQVSVIATVETSYIDGSGKNVIIYPSLKIPLAHYSTWVLDGTTWKVNKDR